jgi:hypothetical protein
VGRLDRAAIGRHFGQARLPVQLGVAVDDNE